MPSLKDLLAKREALEQEIQATQKRERQEAIAKINEIMSMHGLTLSDISGKSPNKAGVPKGTKIAAKYRNPKTGETWSGRGLHPNWLKAALASGKKLTDFEL